MKKLILSALSCVCFSSLLAQNVQRCGTPVPSAEWDMMFNNMVSTFKTQRANEANEKTTSTSTYTIPVIIHVIHGGQAVGTYPNLLATQINSQIQVLNQDFGGTGMGVSSYTALSSGGNGPFYDYAQANTLPAPDNTTAGVTVSNTGITFMAATKDPNGNILPEPGIDRIDYTAHSWNNPTSYTTATTLQTYIDGTVKPATIWDITKYYNIWISDQAASTPLIEYVTFPAGTSLAGLSSGAGTATTDGSYTYSKMFGSITIEPNGTYDATLKYGRTLTHSAGHYLGLRHTWGDGSSCPATTDYCNDTPPQATVNYYGSYTSNTSYIYPCNTNTCSNTGTYASDNGDGIMYMNFMNYSDDAFMCLFTNDQATRMQAALTQSPDRKNLTASAIAMSAVSPTASFSVASLVCLNPTAAVACTDASTGNPTSWQWTVSPSTGVSPNTSTSQNPTFTFSATGSYSISLKVTNTLGSDSVTHTINVGTQPTLYATSSSSTICIGQTDTLKVTGALTYTWAPGGSNLNPYIITPFSPATYTVVGTDANGCTAITTLGINVLPLPTLNVTASSTISCNGANDTLTAVGANTYSWTPGAYSQSKYIVNPSSLTVYSVTGINANGCVSSIYTISINAAFTSSISITPSLTVCSGDSVHIAALGATSYHWSTNNSLVVSNNSYVLDYPTVATNYYVSYIDNNGCSGLDSTKISVNPSPTASYTLVADIVPHVWDVTPQATGGVTPYAYLWSWGDGSTDNIEYTSHTYTVAAHYNICLMVTDANGCANTYCENDSLYRTTQNSTMIQVDVGNGTTAISQASASRVTIYPNPANSSIQITGMTPQDEIKIIDVMGNEIINKEKTIFDNGLYKVNVSELNAGTYFVNITLTNGIIETHKLLIMPK